MPDPAPPVGSPAWIDHLTRPRGVGPLPGATHAGEAVDGACGDRLRLEARVEGGVVREARYRVEGCTGAIAVGSALVTLLPGRTARRDAVSTADLERELGGVPPTRRHALRLALAALAATLPAPPVRG